MIKQSRKEANRVASLIKAAKTDFYVADIDLEDDSNDVEASIELILKTLGKVRAAFAIISAGTTKITLATYVPEEMTDKISHQTWAQESTKNIQGTDQQTNTTSFYTLISKNVDMPFKLKDTLRSMCFTYLKKIGALEEEESSEEFIGLDDL